MELTIRAGSVKALWAVVAADHGGQHAVDPAVWGGGWQATIDIALAIHEYEAVRSVLFPLFIAAHFAEGEVIVDADSFERRGIFASTGRSGQGKEVSATCDTSSCA